MEYMSFTLGPNFILDILFGKWTPNRDEANFVIQVFSDVLDCFVYRLAKTGNATRVIRGMSEVVLRRNELIKNTKLKVVNATMVPTLLYGCEHIKDTTVKSASHTYEGIERSKQGRQGEK